MMMQLFIVYMFEMLVLFSEGCFPDDAGLQKFTETPVDRGPRNTSFIFLTNFIEIFRGEMPMGLQDLLKHNFSATANFQSIFLQISVKFLLLFFYNGLPDHMRQCINYLKKIKAPFRFLLRGLNDKCFGFN